MKFLQWMLVCMILLSAVPSFAADAIVCGHGLAPCGSSPIQGFRLQNSQTTGGAIAAVTVTLAAVTGMRHHIYSVEARCNTAANTSGITITDGGTTIWSTVATEVLAATNFFRKWDPALTGATSSAVVITLAACAAGTGTLIVQADRY